MCLRASIRLACFAGTCQILVKFVSLFVNYEIPASCLGTRAPATAEELDLARTANDLSQCCTVYVRVIPIVEICATRRSEPKVWAAKKNLAGEAARSQNTTLFAITVTVKMTNTTVCRRWTALNEYRTYLLVFLRFFSSQIPLEYTYRSKIFNIFDNIVCRSSNQQTLLTPGAGRRHGSSRSSRVRYYVREYDAACLSDSESGVVTSLHPKHFRYTTNCLCC